MNRTFDIHEINQLLKNDHIYETLSSYCIFLSDMYNVTNEGSYRIKYNDLYRVLYHTLSDAKMEEFFNSFATSLDIYPIMHVDGEGISLVKF